MGELGDDSGGIMLESQPQDWLKIRSALNKAQFCFNSNANNSAVAVDRH